LGSGLSIWDLDYLEDLWRVRGSASTNLFTVMLKSLPFSKKYDHRLAKELKGSKFQYDTININFEPFFENYSMDQSHFLDLFLYQHKNEKKRKREGKFQCAF